MGVIRYCLFYVFFCLNLEADLSCHKMASLTKPLELNQKTFSLKSSSEILSNQRNYLSRVSLVLETYRKQIKDISQSSMRPGAFDSISFVEAQLKSINDSLPAPELNKKLASIHLGLLEIGELYPVRGLGRAVERIQRGSQRIPSNFELSTRVTQNYESKLGNGLEVFDNFYLFGKLISKDKPMLFSGIKFETIVHLLSQGIFPVESVISTRRAHGENMSPKQFFNHDHGGHRLQIEASYKGKISKLYEQKNLSPSLKSQFFIESHNYWLLLREKALGELDQKSFFHLTIIIHFLMFEAYELLHPKAPVASLALASSTHNSLVRDEVFENDIPLPELEQAAKWLESSRLQVLENH